MELTCSAASDTETESTRARANRESGCAAVAAVPSGRPLGNLPVGALGLLPEGDKVQLPLYLLAPPVFHRRNIVSFSSSSCA